MGGGEPAEWQGHADYTHHSGSNVILPVALEHPCCAAAAHSRTVIFYSQITAVSQHLQLVSMMHCVLWTAAHVLGCKVPNAPFYEHCEFAAVED